jgi:hypothetical protein
MGMQWQVGSTLLDFDDIGLRGAYQPRHAASKRHQQSRASVQSRARVADLGGLYAARKQGYASQVTTASCQSYGFPAVPIRDRLLRRAAAFVRRRSRRNDRSQPAAQPGRQG